MKPRHLLPIGLLLLAAAVCSGCVTEIIKPTRELTLSVARVGDVATISWPAQPGVYYTLMYADPVRGRPTQWHPLPGAINMTVTTPGENMIVQDRAEARLQRRYTLHQSPTALPGRTQ